jgi:RNA polymerase primary sigma factor
MQHYLNSIGRVKLLTAEEEIKLARKIQAGWEILQGIQEQLGNALDAEGEAVKKLGFTAIYALYSKLPIDKKQSLLPIEQTKIVRAAKRAYDQMMTANLRLVVSIAKKNQKRGLELLDLIQEGSAALDHAVDKFDHTKGYKFSTYATWWIRQAIGRAINEKSRTIRLPVHVGEKLSKLRRVTRKLDQELGRTPNRQEIAAAMGMELDELEKLLKRTRPAVSLDRPVGEKRTSSSLDLLQDPARPSPYEVVDAILRRESLERVLSDILEDQERNVLSRRYGLDGHEPQTLEAIGEKFNVTRECIRQIEARALKKLGNSASQNGGLRDLLDSLND